MERLKKRIEVPWNEAGQEVYRTVLDVAMKVWARAQAATSALVDDVAPGSELIKEYYQKGGWYLRTVRKPDGKRMTAYFDYSNKIVGIFTKAEERQCKQGILRENPEHARKGDPVNLPIRRRGYAGRDLQTV